MNKLLFVATCAFIFFVSLAIGFYAGSLILSYKQKQDTSQCEIDGSCQVFVENTREFKILAQVPDVCSGEVPLITEANEIESFLKQQQLNTQVY